MLNNKKLRFKDFLYKNREVFKKLGISEKEARNVLDIISPDKPENDTFFSMGNKIKDLNYSKSYEVLIAICMASLKEAYINNVGTIIENSKRGDYVRLNIYQETLFNLFNLIQSPTNLASEYSFSTFVSVITIAGFLNICDNAELIKFLSNLCKLNNFDFHDVLQIFLNSYRVYINDVKAHILKNETDTRIIH